MDNRILFHAQNAPRVVNSKFFKHTGPRRVRFAIPRVKGGYAVRERYWVNGRGGYWKCVKTQESPHKFRGAD